MTTCFNCRYFCISTIQTDAGLSALRDNLNQTKIQLMASDTETKETLIAVNSSFTREVRGLFLLFSCFAFCNSKLLFFLLFVKMYRKKKNNNNHQTNQTTNQSIKQTNKQTKDRPNKTAKSSNQPTNQQIK